MQLTPFSHERIALTDSARAVLSHLVVEGPSTRPQLAEALGLSRPTMSAAIAQLEGDGFVERIGMIRGALGRGAAEFRVGRSAGHVVAVDAGSTHVSLRVSTLDRRQLHHSVLPLPASHFQMDEDISGAVSRQVAAALVESQPHWGPLRTLGIALPTRVLHAGDTASATQQNLVFARFKPPPQVDLVLENNVNCAAVAEYHYGVARGTPTFAYVQVGLKIGMGYMLGGQLIRGHNGAAGEIGHITFPFAPGLRPEPGAAERYLGTEALIGRVAADWPADAGSAPADTSELLRQAEAGVAAACAHVERHAEDIGALVAACVCIVDPGLVVLGGGLGSAPQIAPTVAKIANRLAYPVRVASSLLGAEATLLGIEKLAIDHTLAVILGAANT